jgi:hypothetical protein
MSLVFHDWGTFGLAVATLVPSSLGLYAFWFRNLKSEAQCEAEDAWFEDHALHGATSELGPSERC